MPDEVIERFGRPGSPFAETIVIGTLIQRLQAKLWCSALTDKSQSKYLENFIQRKRYRKKFQISRHPRLNRMIQ